VLLQHEAPVDAKDDEWEAMPIEWALYGWQNNTGPGHTPERYHAVVRLLVAAGATVRPEWLEEEPVRADTTMQAALGRH
jgi:hypothetical protein